MHPVIQGTWHNQHGSELDLSIDAEGLIRGHFRSAVGFSPGRQSPVTGFATGDLLSFVTQFSNHDCVTAWVGHYRVQDGLECIETLWHMAGMSPDAPAGQDVWRSVWAGADVFHRGAAGAGSGGGRMPSHPTGYRGGRTLPRPR
jgi:Avidin family